jgi:3-mercaptopyruvate sulfurtransferase SseA
MANGFKKVRPLHGGLDAWIAAGYTVDTMPVGDARLKRVPHPAG